MARAEIKAVGPLALLCLLLVSSLTLSAAGVISLSLIAALSVYLIRSASLSASSLNPVLLSLSIVYCAVEFDPGVGVLKGGSGHIISSYRWALIAIVLAWSLLDILWRFHNRTARPRPLDTTDRWVVGTGILAVAYFTCFVPASSEAGPGPSSKLAADALLISCPIIYLKARDAIDGNVSAHWVSRALVTLFLLAALSGAARLAAFYYYYDQAGATISEGMAKPARDSLRKASGLSGSLEIARLGAMAQAREGYSYYAEGRYGLALKSAENAENLDDGYYDAYRLKGVLYSAWGRWGDAVESFERARSLKPAITDYYGRLALAYSWTRQWERGGFLEGYKGDLADGVTGAENMAALSTGLNKWGRYKEARLLADKALALGEVPYQVYLQRGIATEGLGNLAEAEKDYLLAIGSSTGRDIGAYGRLEGLYNKTGRPDEAEMIREKGLGLETLELDLPWFKTTPHVYWWHDRMDFQQNGSAFRPVSLYKGSFRLRMTARGEKSRDEYPRCRVMLDAREVGSFYVDSGQWKTYETSFQVEDADVFRLSIVYFNDLYLPGQDRNLYVRDIAITRGPDED